MANLKLKNPSGGSLNLVSADGASDLTVTFPAATGTAMVSGNMPTFKVSRSPSQSLTGDTYTKIQFNVEEWGTANCFDSTTNYRFTPNVAGYYYFTLSVSTTNAGSINIYPVIYKNNSFAINGMTGNGVAGVDNLYYATGMLYCNGTTDYIEGYCYVGSTVGTNTGVSQTHFEGFLVRTA